MNKRFVVPPLKNVKYHYEQVYKYINFTNLHTFSRKLENWSKNLMESFFTDSHNHFTSKSQRIHASYSYHYIICALVSHAKQSDHWQFYFPVWKILRNIRKNISHLKFLTISHKWSWGIVYKHCIKGLIYSKDINLIIVSWFLMIQSNVLVERNLVIGTPRGCTCNSFIFRYLIMCVHSCVTVCICARLYAQGWLKRI